MLANWCRSTARRGRSIANQKIKCSFHIIPGIDKSINASRVICCLEQVVHCLRMIFCHLVVISQLTVVGLKVGCILSLECLCHLSMQGASPQRIEPLVQYLADFIMRKREVEILPMITRRITSIGTRADQRREYLNLNRVINMLRNDFLSETMRLAEQRGAKLTSKHSS